MTAPFGSLFLSFAELSVLCFGGGNAALPEMQKRVVDQTGWLSATDFSTLFALAQAAPGPNMMVVPLIGDAVAGLPGVAVISLAFFLPSSLLLLASVQMWDRFRDTLWAKRLRIALLPLTCGLVVASAFLMVKNADSTLLAAGITFGAAAANRFTRLHPLAILAIGGAFGIAAGGWPWTGTG